MEKITIVGLGFIGTSIGHSLRAKGGKNLEVVGYDSVSNAQNRAKKANAIDRAEWGLPAAVQDADLVVLAVPGMPIRQLFEDIAPHLKPGAVVTDTTTVKRRINEWADELLPNNVGFVSGNPLVNGSGVENANAEVFREARWVIAPAPRAPSSAVASVVKLAERVGAKPFFTTADEHDSYIAAGAHLPIVVSHALMLAGARSPSWREIQRFASDDFREQSRLARLKPEETLGAIGPNSDMIVHWIDQLIAELSDLRVMIEDENRDDPDSPLNQTFNNAWDARIRWESGVAPGEIERAPLPTTGQMMLGLFLGDKAAQALSGNKRNDND